MNKLFLTVLCTIALLSGCRKSTQIERPQEEVQEKRVSGPECAGVEMEKEDYR